MSAATAFKAIHADAEPVKIGWAAPDMSVLSAGRRAPPTMPRDMFGNVWPILSDLAEGAGAPVDYVALGFATVAASLIGGKRRVRPFSDHHWTEPCIIWAAAVGDPSSNKSPAIDAASGPLRGMEADHADENKRALQIWEAEAERAKVEQAAWAENVKSAQKDNLATPAKPDAACIPDEPVRRRLFVQDATPESLATILSGNPSGTLHLRDELAGWLLSFDRYSGGGGREFWLEAYGGRQHTVDRKGTKGPITVPFNGVSVLGGIQPEKLSDCLLNGSDDGLVARFLWAWPDSLPFQRPRKRADLFQFEQILRRLDGLQWGYGPDGERVAITLDLDGAAADLFERWGVENDQGLDDAGALFKGFCGKLKGTVLRLALIAELVAWAAGDGDDEPRRVSARSVAAAATFADEYAKPSALRVFGDAALPPVERHAAMIGRYIRKHRLARVNARDLYKPGGVPALRDAADKTNEALAFLSEADWLRDAGTRSGETHGRRRSDFAVNPAVHERP